MRVSGRRARLLAAGGVLAAGIIAVCVNVLSHRFYKRWDVTSSGLYTLSQATLETLHGLSDPVDVIVFLSASDPLNTSVQHMLAAYGSETKLLRPRFVDPDRSPAEFIALQKEYGIVAGKTEDGRVVTDASLVIAHGPQHWFVTTEDMVVYDEKDNQARPKLEQALTEGIRNVLSREKTEVCFTTGHQEISADDGGSRGLAELKYHIQKDNYATKTVDLASPDKRETLDGCRVVVVAGPDVPVSQAAAARLEAYFVHGGNVLVLANPILDDENRIRDSGLGRLLSSAGIEFGGDFIVERDPALRMPQGLGETYFATPKAHDITAGLVVDDEVKLRPVLTASQSLRATKDSVAKPLLVTSALAFGVKDIRPFVEEGKAVEKHSGDTSGPFVVAMAAERDRPEGSHEKHGPRLVAIGTANVAFGQTFRDATLLGNRVFVESAISWLAAKPAIVSVPEKPSHPVGLSLTEDALSEVLRYVLVYMPGAALVLGGLILVRRRGAEKKSRQAVQGGKRPGGAS
ncbi:MAG TPA: GldG family protein [Polyangiaceae bacterium]|nr:GldG family protein [Polyangiaceae bacterium]